MSPQRHFPSPFAARQPRRNAARAVARKLCLAPVRIEEPQKKLTAGLSLQKFNAIRSNTGVPRTKLACEFGMTTLCQWLVDDEKIIAASMRFDEGNHVFLLCLTDLWRTDNVHFGGLRISPIGFINPCARLPLVHRIVISVSPSGCAATACGDRVSGNRDNINSMFGRRGQSGLEAVVVPFVDCHPKRNPASCSAPT